MLVPLWREMTLITLGLFTPKVWINGLGLRSVANYETHDPTTSKIGAHSKDISEFLSSSSNNSNNKELLVG